MPPKKKPQNKPAEQPPAPETSANTALKQRYPGRESQIDDLATLLNSSLHTAIPILVYGPPGTGKTSVVLDLLRELKIPRAYINCEETTRTRTVIESILHQLKGAKRRREDGYGPAVKCDSLNDFLISLPTILPRSGASPWIVIDSAQRLAGSDLFSALAHLSKTCSSRVGVLFISNVAQNSGRYMERLQKEFTPESVDFLRYNVQQLIKILMLKAPAEAQQAQGGKYAQEYRQFLNSVVPALFRASTDLTDIRLAVGTLWPKYSAPLKAGQTSALSGKMYALIKNDLQRAIGELEMGRGIKKASADAGGNDAAGPSSSTAGTAGTSSAAAPSGLTFELPYMSKFLLLAAYIASRNKPTTDRAVFDPGYSKRGRKDSQALDRQAEAAVEATLRGPHSFPLERLLHIFYSIYDQHGPEDGHQGLGFASVALPKGAAHEIQRAEVLMQLTTLVALRLLSVSGGDILEESVYRCNLTDDVALAVADNVQMRLGDYLKLA